MKYLIILVMTSLCTVLMGQSITGTWENIDDNTNEKKAVIEIHEDSGIYYAKIIQLLLKPQDTICEACKGSKKNKPLVGMIIVENLKKKGHSFEGGKILDPESGKTYKCKMELTEDNILEVRGFIGISLLGRTQYWYRKV